MRILIAYDDSSFARAAIDDLKRAGLPQDGRALVVSVIEIFLPMAALPIDPIAVSTASHRVAATLVQARAETEQAIEEASTHAREGVRRVHRLFPHWEVSMHPVAGTPAQAILRKAENWRADMIVLGSHGRSALGRLVLGSVSIQVASESSRTVRVARHVVSKGDGPVRVIVGVDGSIGAEAAVHAVASRRWPQGTEVRVIAVDDTVRPTGTLKSVPTAAEWISGSNDEQLAKMRAMVDRAADDFLDAGLLVSSRSATGSPRDVLNGEASTWEADCIFVGARGVMTDRSNAHAGLGSVATALVSSAPCSVEITRA
jgi:nucleotide-binding universal stress UspA family protein